MKNNTILFSIYILFALCNTMHAQNIWDFTSIPDEGQNENLKLPSTHNFQYLTYETEFGTLGLHDFTAYVAIAGASDNGYLSINHEEGTGGVSVFDISQDATSREWNLSNLKQVEYENINRPCSGAITSWGTVLACSEADYANNTNNGKVVEVNPVTGTGEFFHQLGILAHENAVEDLDNNRVFYTGEDRGDGIFLKFVADVAGDLSSGTLYALQVDDDGNGNLGPGGNWIEIDNADNVNTNAIADAAGATLFPRIEDIEISPNDDQIYFALTTPGTISRFVDDTPLAGGTISNYEVYVENTTYNTGNGTADLGSGVDNLAFDNIGNLWAFSDGSGSQMWVVEADHTVENPQVKLFGQAPNGAEPTGITFTPDNKYMFMSVQHPNGNDSQNQPDEFGTTIPNNLSYSVVIARNEEWALNPGAFTDFSAFDPSCSIETIANGIEVSGAAFDPNLNRILALSNGNVPDDRYLNILELNGSSNPTNGGTIDLVGFGDPEAITHVADDIFAIADESDNIIYQVFIEENTSVVTILDDSVLPLELTGVDFAFNQGIEGLAYSAADDRMYFVEEGNDTNNGANPPQLYYVEAFSEVFFNAEAIPVSLNLEDFFCEGANVDFSGLSIFPDGTLLITSDVCDEVYAVQVTGSTVTSVDNLDLGHVQAEGVTAVSENEFWVAGEEDELQLFYIEGITECDDGNPITEIDLYGPECICGEGIIIDTDEDGIVDAEDNCPETPNSDQADNDNDNIGDACDDDDDNDGVLDIFDNCPFTFNSDQEDIDFDEIGDACDPDDDNDGILDEQDNCPFQANPNQENNDNDALGDICDNDDDNDGIMDAMDNCPLTSNSNQADLDGDEIGDVCDNDIDGDGVPNDDDCNPNDGDQFQGAPCDDGNPDTIDDEYDANCICVGFPADSDEDGIIDALDNCPEIFNPEQEDLDDDEIGDVCDNDIDGDGVLNGDDCNPTDATQFEGAVCDDGDPNTQDDAYNAACICVGSPIDSDEDGVVDALDNCPNTFNPGQEDLDDDEIGDVCDTDIDGDGVLNDDDCNPTDATQFEGAVCDDGDPNTINDVYNADCVCGGAIIDSDEDGIADGLDNCPNTFNPGQEDLDEDEIGDVCDTDIDGDGVLNDDDCNPTDATQFEGAVCDDGDPNTQDDAYNAACICVGSPIDSDEDGVVDALDNCPNTFNPGQEDLDDDEIGDVCDNDIDGDGVLNGDDCNPTDATQFEGAVCDDGDPNTINDVYNADCVCGGAIIDSDEDGIADGLDNCPNTFNPGQEDLDDDEIGDVCDTDIDGDGVLNGDDCNPTDATQFEGAVCDDGDPNTINDVYNADCVCGGAIIDSDEDGIADGLDNCPNTFNPGQEDLDEDEIGDVCDTDIDGDGVINEIDNCPLLANTDQADNEGDEIGDVCDTDDDNDGVADDMDNCQFVFNPNQEDLNDNGIGDACENETCNDGILNNGEAFVDCGGPNCDPCPCVNEAQINTETECILIFEPVCGCDGITYGNDCEAVNFGGVTSWTEGACPTCEDGIQNGDEEGIDCGGPDCEPCETCEDGIQNGDEEGIDCGGEFCDPCPSCNDGILNNGEEFVDCGGPNCDPCPCINEVQINPEIICPDVVAPVCGCDGFTYVNECDAINFGGVTSWTEGPCPDCEDGIQNGDETGIDCGGELCPPCIECDDGIQNGNEEGIDCGGDFCPPCETCNDGILNNDEEFVDCGGDFCEPCECVNEAQIDLEEICLDVFEPVCGCDGVTYNNPCEAEFYGGVTSWTFGECDTCNDGIQNGDEEGIDCGGELCLPCETCNDGILNNGEEFIDCGGPNCAPCPCVNEVQINPEIICPDIFLPVCGCDGNTYPNECVAINLGGLTSWIEGACPTCDDGIQNGDETGIDCGGPDCAPCDTCEDGIQNGDEEGIDCGGPDCAPCEETPCTDFYGVNFENGFGEFNDGGSDCRLSINDAEFANSGLYCVRLRDNTNTSVTTSNLFNFSGFDGIQVSFNFIADNMEEGEDLWLQISTNGGATYTTVADYNSGFEFFNGIREFESVYIPGPFTENCRVRFRLDASNNGDFVYLDDIVIETCSEGTCDDGILNNGETFIDCGGPNCDPCPCVNDAQINNEAICTDEFEPVCGCDGVTYSNVCEAINYGGVTEWTEGECFTLPCIEIYSTDFEDGFGQFNDAGSDCRLSINDAEFANSGDYCVRLRDNTSTSNTFSEIYDFSSYEVIEVSFNFIADNMEFEEDLWVQISQDGGASYTTVADYDSGIDFLNGIREFETVYIDGPFSTNCIIRFALDASNNGDFVYLDDVSIQGCSENADGTCTDGILNNGEEFVDCGGPNCEPCDDNCTGFEFNDLEDGLGGWIDGGSDCRVSINDAEFAFSGDYCVRLRDNSSSSVFTSPLYTIPPSTFTALSFTYIADNMETGESFHFEVSEDDGDSWTTLLSYVSGSQFVNGQRKFEFVALPTAAGDELRFRFRCDASNNGDFIYIDDIELEACDLDIGDIKDESEHAALMSADDDTEVQISSREEKSYSSDFTLYPNPISTSGNLQLEFEYEQALVKTQVFGLEGNLVSEQEWSDTELIKNIPVQNLSPGTYILKVSTNGMVAVKRFIVIR